MMNKPLTLRHLLILGLLTPAFIWFVQHFSPLIGPLMVAGLLAYLLNPLVGLIEARLPRLPRRFVVLLVYLAFLIAVGVGTGLLVPAALSQYPVVFSALNSLPDAVMRLENTLSGLGIQLELTELARGLQTRLVQSLDPAAALQTIQRASANVVWVLLVIVMLYYLLLDWDRLRAWLFNLLPAAHRPEAERLYVAIKGVWRAYLLGQLALMTVMGVLSGVTAAAIGLPGALDIGILTGVLDIIPSLGPTIAIFIAAIIAWVRGSTFLPLSEPAFMLLVIGLFSGIQVLENVWLRPHIMGQRLRLHPGLVFLAVISALALVGILAALVVVPLLATADLLLRYGRARAAGEDPWASLAE